MAVIWGIFPSPLGGGGGRIAILWTAFVVISSDRGIQKFSHVLILGNIDFWFAVDNVG
jgi:hypothetical protein